MMNPRIKCQKINSPVLTQIANESIPSFVAKTIDETILPLQSVLVYPHLTGAHGKDGELFLVAKKLANEISLELQRTGQSAQRFSIDSWIDGNLLGKTITYKDDGAGCMVAKVSPALKFPKRTIRVVTLPKWAGPAFEAEGYFDCVLIPSEHYSIESRKVVRPNNVLLSDLQSVISPNKRFGVLLQAFEINDEIFGSWIFAHARWSDTKNAEVEASRKAAAGTTTPELVHASEPGLCA